MTSADDQGDAAEPQANKKPRTTRKTGASKDAPEAKSRKTSKDSAASAQDKPKRATRKPKDESDSTKKPTAKRAGATDDLEPSDESPAVEKMPYEVERDTTIDRRAAARRRHSQTPIRAAAIQRVTDEVSTSRPIREPEPEVFDDEIEVEVEAETEQPPSTPQPPGPRRAKSLEETVIEILGTPDQPQAVVVDVDGSDVPDISERQARKLLIWAGILVGVTILLISGLAVGSNLISDDDKTTTPTTGTTQITVPTTATTATTGSTSVQTTETSVPQQTSLPLPGSTVAIQLSGNGPRQSALFNLPTGNVRVTYSTTGGTLNVRLLRQASTGDGDTFNCNEPCDRVATVTETAGSYYLDVDARNGEWNVRVEY